MPLPANNKLSDEQILEVIELLETADQNHRDWLQRMHMSIICHQPFDADVFTEDAHRCCMFGQWYYNNAPELLKPRAEFIALEPLHQAMHDAARRLAGICSEGQSVTVSDYEDFVDRQRNFSGALLALRDSLREYLYSFDALTGLMTRQPFSLVLESEYARIERTGASSCIVLIDIDLFKSINDNYGHITGDHVLRDVAQFVRNNLRSYDTVCRYGGEEFLIILPNTSTRKAFEIIDRLRKDIAELDMRNEQGVAFQVTISAGIAPLSDSMEKTSVGMADKALYQAKNSGRNRVCVAEDDRVQC